MASAALQLAVRITRIVVALLPWAASLYLHYWLEYGAVWQVDGPYRGLISVVVIALGMGMSFVLYNLLLRRRAGKGPSGQTG